MHVLTCHLHFWQNDQGVLCATAVTQGVEQTPNKSQNADLTLEKKILLSVCWDSNLHFYNLSITSLVLPSWGRVDTSTLIFKISSGVSILTFLEGSFLFQIFFCVICFSVRSQTLAPLTAAVRCSSTAQAGKQEKVRQTCIHSCSLQVPVQHSTTHQTILY